MLLLDSLLNFNANTFYKLCMWVHIYLTYTTVDFSFQSFAQFLFFPSPHRSWYSASRTLRNAGLYSVTLSTVYDEECRFLSSWWILVENFSILHQDVTKQKGQEATLGCSSIPYIAHTAGQMSSLNSRAWKVVRSGAELWHVWVTVVVQEKMGGGEGWWHSLPPGMDLSWGRCSLCPLKESKPWEFHYISTKSMSYWFIVWFGSKPGNRLSLLKVTLCLTISCSHNCPAAGQWPDRGLCGQNICLCVLEVKTWMLSLPRGWYSGRPRCFFSPRCSREDVGSGLAL